MKAITRQEEQIINKFQRDLARDCSWSLSHISGGYLTLETGKVTDTDILIIVKSGVQSDCEDRRYEDHFRYDRDNREISRLCEPRQRYGES